MSEARATATQAHTPVTLEEAEAAARRLDGIAMRTPLLPLAVDTTATLHAKLEVLQPTGSFKLRGSVNGLMQRPREELADGVWTASAGNMAQGVAWCARELGVPATVVVPDNAAEAKLDALRRLGARIEPVSLDEFFETFTTRERPAMRGRFIHAFSDHDVMAGNATIGLEILADMPDVRAIYIPYGGGGLSCGIASVVKQLKPDVRIIACEPAPGASLAASWRAGTPQTIEFTPSFVDGAGGPYVYPEMFDLARRLLDDAVAVSLADVAEAIRLLAERARVVAEGAGALAVAAALRHPRAEPVACIVSGGNINRSWLTTILSGGIPAP